MSWLHELAPNGVPPALAHPNISHLYPPAPAPTPNPASSCSVSKRGSEATVSDADDDDIASDAHAVSSDVHVAAANKLLPSEGRAALAWLLEFRSTMVDRRELNATKEDAWRRYELGITSVNALVESNALSKTELKACRARLEAMRDKTLSAVASSENAASAFHHVQMALGLRPAISYRPRPACTILTGPGPVTAETVTQLVEKMRASPGHVTGKDGVGMDGAPAEVGSFVMGCTVLDCGGVCVGHLIKPTPYVWEHRNTQRQQGPFFPSISMATTGKAQAQAHTTQTQAKRRNRSLFDAFTPRPSAFVCVFFPEVRWMVFVAIEAYREADWASCGLEHRISVVSSSFRLGLKSCIALFGDASMWKRKRDLEA